MSAFYGKGNNEGVVVEVVVLLAAVVKMVKRLMVFRELMMVMDMPKEVELLAAVVVTGE